jgi:hypothetical protein
MASEPVSSACQTHQNTMPLASAQAPIAHAAFPCINLRTY